jgi:hypothetical protein
MLIEGKPFWLNVAKKLRSPPVEVFSINIVFSVLAKNEK